jgi:hypothetical protein
MNRAKKALVSTVLSISLLLASNCFADTNSTSSYDWVNKTIGVCKAVGTVVRSVSEAGLALLFIDSGFRAVVGRSFIRLRQTGPTLLDHGSPQQASAS